MKETPHALSKQMNKVLISFHEPNTRTGQVLYCTLGMGDRELLEHFIAKYCPTSFPVKKINYKGEEIRIYPMNDGHFLAVCLTQDFLALSFQKKLLEQVIDTRHNKHGGLPDNPSFQTLHNEKIRNVEASLYLRARSIRMGLSNDTLRPTLDMGEWIKFDMKFTKDAIYCTGISQETDTTPNLIQTLRVQKKLYGFGGEHLPASTFLYNRCSISNVDSLITLNAPQLPAQIHMTEYMADRDRELLEYIEKYTDADILSCFFLARRLQKTTSCAVISIPLATDEWKARQQFLTWLQTVPLEKGAPASPRFNPGYNYYPRSQAFRKYLMPRNTVIARLTGITHESFYSYACFYRGHLLMASDALSLSAYIDALEHKDVLQGNRHYELLSSSLASSYSFLLMADMNEVLHQPAPYTRLLPSFFLSNATFFRHFVLAAQFNNHDGIICPNLTLLYSPENLPELP